MERSTSIPSRATSHPFFLLPIGHANRVPRWTHRYIYISHDCLTDTKDVSSCVLPQPRSLHPFYVSVPHQVELIFSPRDMLGRSLLESAVDSKEAETFQAAMTTVTKLLTEEEV